MKQHHAWMSAALTLLLQSTASAQQASEPPRPPAEKALDQAQPGSDLQDAGAQPSVAEHDAASRARTWRHLYGIQVDGVRLSALDKSQVKQLQQALQDQGYYTDSVDGVAGPKTRLALRQYYLDQAALALQDLILPQGASSLGLDEADIERVRGEEARDPRARDAADGDIERTRGEDPVTKPAPASKR